MEDAKSCCVSLFFFHLHANTQNWGSTNLTAVIHGKICSICMHKYAGFLKGKSHIKVCVCVYICRYSVTPNMWIKNEKQARVSVTCISYIADAHPWCECSVGGTKLLKEWFFTPFKCVHPSHLRLTVPSRNSGFNRKLEVLLPASERLALSSPPSPHCAFEPDSCSFLCRCTV